MMDFENLPERHLPEDFAERLVASVRRRRRSRRLGVVSAAIAVALVAAGIVGAFGAAKTRMPHETSLVAGRTSTTNDTHVSAFMLLGLFRECLKCCKSNKKKEEE